MSEEEFFNRLLNKIAKNFGYDVASTLELMFFKKNKEIDMYKEVLDKIKNYLEKQVRIYGGGGLAQEQLDNFNKLLEEIE